MELKSKLPAELPISPDPAAEPKQISSVFQSDVARAIIEGRRERRVFLPDENHHHGTTSTEKGGPAAEETSISTAPPSSPSQIIVAENDLSTPLSEATTTAAISLSEVDHGTMDDEYVINRGDAAV